MNRERCRTVSLATSPPGSVELCVHCGCFHVHIGAVSLRFDRESFFEVGRLIQRATWHALQTGRDEAPARGGFEA